MKLKLNISTKIILFTITLIIVFTLFLGWFFVSHESNAIKAELNERAKTLVSNLAYNSKFGVLVEDKEELTNFAEGIIKQKDIAYAKIKNKQGQVLAEAGNEKKVLIKEFTAPVTATPIPESVEKLGFILDTKEDEVGKVILGITLAGFNKKLNRLKIVILLTIITVIIISSLGVVFGIRYFINRPLVTLISGINRIGGGDLSHRVKVKTKDELGELANSFNRMTEDLSKVLVSKNYVENIIQSMDDTLIVTDAEGKINTVNRALCNLLGYEKDELLQMSANEIFKKDVFAPADESQGFLKIEQIESREISYRTKSRKEIPVLFSANALYDNEQQLSGAVCVGTNISERKKMEEELRESKERFRSIYENTTIGLYRTTPDGKILMANSALIKMMGYSSFDKLRQRSLEKKGYDPEYPRKEFKKLIEQKDEVNGFESAWEKKNGEIIYVRESAKIVHDEDGNILYYEGTVEDMTKRKQAEQALRESEKKYRTVFENTGTASIIIEEDTIISLANSECEKLSGYSREEIEGKKRWTEFVIPEDLEKMKEQHKLRRKQRELALQKYEFRFVAKNNEVKNILLYIDMLPGTKKSVASLLDITERKQAEEQIEKDLKEKTTLLQEIHHRVKNNLQVTSSLLNLQSGKMTDPKSILALQESMRRINSMALIHEKLYKSKKLSSINFTDYIKSLSQELFNSYNDASKNIKLKLNLDDIILGIDSAIPCGLILNELLTNSLKHAFPENNKGKINISFATLKDKSYQLIVRDNGVGIPESIDYDKADSLGLTLIKTLAYQIEGEAKFERNNGTICTLNFMGYEYGKTKYSNS